MSKTSPLPAGLRALSLTKRQAVTLAPSWPHGLVAAFEPYLVSVNKTSLLLWDRRTLALVLAVPAEGVQGAVAFVELELPAGERGWGQCCAVLGASGLLLDVPAAWAAPNPGSCSSANEQRACPAAPPTRDHRVEDEHEPCLKDKPSYHLHHTTSTTQDDHRCASHHSANHLQHVHAGQNHPCTNHHHHHVHPNHHLCARHHPNNINQGPLCAVTHHEELHHHHEEHHEHHHPVRATPARCPTANHEHAAPTQPCTPPPRRPPPLLPSHTRALP